MTRTHIQSIKIRNWFPCEDELSVKILRLCILREDLYLEYHGISAEHIEDLDDNKEISRRLYFWRRSILTLREIKQAIHDLTLHPDFKNTQRTDFEHFKNEIEILEDEYFKNLRNDFAGHIKLSAIETTLVSLDSDMEEFI